MARQAALPFPEVPGAATSQSHRQPHSHRDHVAQFTCTWRPALAGRKGCRGLRDCTSHGQEAARCSSLGTLGFTLSSAHLPRIGTRLYQTDSCAVHCPASGLLGAHGTGRVRLNAGCQLPAKGRVG